MPGKRHTAEEIVNKLREAKVELPPLGEDDEEENYKVVAPPAGATVPYLPEEAAEKTVNGKKYFVYECTYDRPFASDGKTIYMVVEDPTKATPSN